MKNILFCSDLSSHSDAALKFSIEIAKASDAKLEVFHSIHIPVSAIMEDVGSPAVWQAMHISEDEIKRELDSICQSIKNQTSLDIQPIICESIGLNSPEINIEEAADSLDSDLIILGSRNAQGLVKLIGTTSSKIINKTILPVLVVPENAMWNRFQNIIFATDLKDDAFKSHGIIDFAKTFQSNITFVHVDNPGDTGADKKRFAAYRKSITDSTDYPNIKFDSISFKDPALALNEYMYHNKGDLLCLLRHQYGLLEGIIHKSFTKEIIFKSELPVMVMH
jgi:nucleotide-binding universal stress UspA family protein